jgi:SNF2 family DNA or RNA helicase
MKNDNGNTIVTGNLNEDFDLDWDVVIFDESVLLKNRKSKRVSACRTLSRASNKTWLLSGAPTTRDNSDIWAQFNLIEPDYFSSFWRLAEEFCIVVKTQWSQGEILGSRRDISVRDEFPDIMFVRNQEEVFEDLPTYIHWDVELDLHKKQAKAHQDVLDTWLHELEENKDKRVEVTAVIAMLTRLQQITSNLYNLQTTGEEWPDYSAKADFVEEYLAGGDLEWPVLIWCHHRPGAKALLDRLQRQAKKKDSALYRKRSELVVGGTKGADTIIEEFKAGKVDVMILGITVGKYGHTLANAKTIITYDKTWDSDAWFQMLHRAAGARAKLAGFHHRPLLVSPRCRGTVDDYVELNLAGKLPDMANMTGADLAKILRSLGEEHVK